MSRSMNLLAPEHRWALLPAIAARILQTDPKGQSAEDTEVEARLLKTMLQVCDLKWHDIPRWLEYG